MKKSIYYSMIVLAGLFLTNACSKDKPIVPIDPTEESEGITLPETISVTIPDNLTRVSLTQDEDVDGSVKLAWDEDDMIYVAGHGDNETWITYAIDTPLGENPHVATFSKVGEETITAESFDILYGAPTLTMAESIDFSVQTQEGNASTGNLQYMALISGVNTVENVQFTSDWASANGGSFKQTGVVRLRLQMPTNVTAVSSVFLAASSAVFNTTNKLDAKTDMIKVNFTSDVNIADDQNIVTVYASLPWADVSVPGGNDLTAVVKASDGYYYSKAISNASGFTFSTGSVNAVKLSRSGFGIFAGGSGVDGDPYTIASKWHMMNTKPRTDAATDGSVTYFKLLNDIDMSGVTWEMLNPSSPYQKLINFDGNDKIISNLATSLFYVFKGSVKDLTLKNATIGSGTHRGALAQYIQGTGNVITNVDITDCNVSGNNNSGALIGRINSGSAGSVTATITDCDVTNTSVKGACAGGLLGSVEAKVIVSNCSYSGNTVTGTTQKIGGLVGITSDNLGCTFTGCRVESATVDASGVTGDARVGGFIGQHGEGNYIYGCTVGTSGENVKVKAGAYDTTNSKPVNTGGFVGVNYGIISKDVNDNHSKAYVTVTSTNKTGNPINLGGFAGFQRGTIEYSDAVVSMGDLQGQYIGGFCGYIVFQNGKTVITDNCTVVGDGDPETVDVKGNNFTGGFVGVAENGLFTITNCQVLEGTVVVGQSTAGGFAGQIKSGTVENCSAYVTMQSRGGNAGGFVGAITGGTVQNCFAAGTLSQISSTNTVFGGFVGYLNGVDLKKCYSTMDITVARSYIGGLIGELQTANTVSECYYDGTISGPTNIKGGLIGRTLAVAAVITNCYTAGELVGSSGTQVYGGIVGELGMDASVTNCYSTMDMTHGGRATGGIVGRACNGGWPVSNESNNTISKCIAWNPAITFDGTPSTSASSGAIIGYTSFKNILNNCYRRSDMVYKNSNTAVGTSCQTSMVDQIDCDGTNWAINGNRPAGTTPAGTSADAQYQAPYYGVAATSDATVSSIAQTLGWSSSIWDFSNDLPTLK